MQYRRAIARTLDLNMKIGDVEFQGDGKKATFYYTADGRVDFRELIRHFAKEFKIKVEMRQIGATSNTTSDSSSPTYSVKPLNEPGFLYLRFFVPLPTGSTASTSDTKLLFITFLEAIELYFLF